VVVRNNGDEGGRFERGSTRVVVGSDVGGRGALTVIGVEATPGGGGRTREAAAVAFGPGRKMTGWGPRVSRARRGAKAVRGEAFPLEGGGKRARRHRLTAIWAERAG
jgi:hypothetical protein